MSPGETKEGAIVIRPHRPGDLGWIVHRHGVLYFEEMGWDERFEALVTSVVAEFGRGHDPERERCWIAELDGTPVGSVLLVRGSEGAARLRLMLVEPWARGRGLGRQLLEECLAFARGAGYERVILWTNGDLRAAKHLYSEAGFRKVGEEPHDLFGEGLVGETWELGL
jgi:N-acetylglutamate synthase-like GNAT family acetyltransferase